MTGNGANGKLEVRPDSGAGAPPDASLAGELDRWIEPLGNRLSTVVASRELPLPAYPAVALKLQEVLAHGADIAEVARVVGADSALAADVLRCANSAMYRRAGRPATLAQAITQIGTQQVLRLALVSGLAGRALASGPMGSVRRRYWMEGLAGAVVSQELAELRRLPADHAFLLGLLHDFGKIVVLQCLETFWSEAADRPAVRPVTLHRLAEAHHVSLGLVLAQRWRFPDLLQEVIAAHHDGGAAQFGPFPELIMTSDRIVDLLGRTPALTAADLASLPGLKGPAEVDAVRRLAAQIPEFVSAFEPDAEHRQQVDAGVAGPRPRDVRPLPSPLPVEVALRGRAFEYRAVALDREGMVVEGGQPLPENRLVHVKLLIPDAFEFWSLCGGKDVAPSGQARIELRPYALDGVSQARWAGLSEQPAWSPSELVAARPPD